MHEPRFGRGLVGVTEPELKRLLRAVHRSILAFPITRSGLVTASFGDIEEHLDSLVGQDQVGAQRLIAAVLAERGRGARGAELVFTGPELPGSISRDTRSVVEELIASASQSVFIAGLTPEDDPRVLRTLRVAMAGRGITSTVIVDVRSSDRTPEAALTELVALHWPSEARAPQLYAGPRAGDPRGAVGARLVVVDKERFLVTSASLSAIEDEGVVHAGAVVDHPALARVLTAQLEQLILAGCFERLDAGR